MKRSPIVPTNLEELAKLCTRAEGESHVSAVSELPFPDVPTVCTVALNGKGELAAVEALLDLIRTGRAPAFEFFLEECHRRKAYSDKLVADLQQAKADVEFLAAPFFAEVEFFRDEARVEAFDAVCERWSVGKR